MSEKSVGYVSILLGLGVYAVICNGLQCYRIPPSIAVHTSCLIVADAFCPRVSAISHSTDLTASEEKPDTIGVRIVRPVVLKHSLERLFCTVGNLIESGGMNWYNSTCNCEQADQEDRHFTQNPTWEAWLNFAMARLVSRQVFASLSLCTRARVACTLSSLCFIDSTSSRPRPGVCTLPAAVSKRDVRLFLSHFV